MTRSNPVLGRIIAVFYPFLFVGLLIPSVTQAGPELRGKVYRLGPQDELEPVPNTTVRIEATDDSNVTTSTGGFRLYLPDLFKPGQTVTLQVDLEGYRILIPHGGQVRIPAAPLTDPVQIRLDKKGSHRFMNHEAFALLMENVANKAKEQVKTGDEPQEVDLSRYLKDWAVKYGFGLDEVRAELDKWAAEIEATSVNFYELGLAAFYKKNFGEAATNFTRSAQAHDRQLVKIREQLAKGREQEAELREKVIRDYLLAGNAHSNDYRFQDAAQSYRSALHMAPREQLPQDWAMTQNNLGLVLQEQGIRTSGEESRVLLAQAVEAYRLALEVYTREQLPQPWATTQNNLGVALANQGIRTGGEDSRALLAQAVDAHRLALEVYTREQLPQHWARTQNNLGIVLQEQGIRTGGENGRVLLAQAVEAYRRALEVYTREQLPQPWATTQNNLGATLANQGIRTSGEDGRVLLAQAVGAYRLALEVYTRQELPQQWAGTQNNLGIALANQGIRTSGEDGRVLLAQAVEACRLALEVYTREQLPQDWATTQNNLGLVLQEQGIRTSGENGRALLAQAVEAYRLALEVRTREALPQQWAMTQANLGATLKALGEHDHNAELLIEAKRAVEAAYTFYLNSGYQHYSDYFENELSQINQMIEKLR